MLNADVWRKCYWDIFFRIMIPHWGEFHVINKPALQHRVLLLLGFPLLKLLFLKSFWLYSWLLLQNWVLQQIAWLTKGKKNVASKQTIMTTLKHNIKCLIDFVPEDWCKEWITKDAMKHVILVHATLLVQYCF